MRARILSSLLAALALVPPSVARAQEEDPPEQGESAEADEGEGETDPAEVVDPSPPSKRVTGGRDSAPGQTHTVVRGDTLWDLSQQYLGTPWQWPKVWSYNPGIANPHWIYPGNLVRFFPEDKAGAASAAAEGGIVVDGTDSDGEDKPSLMENGEDYVQLTGKIGYEAPEARRVVHSGFVTSKELAESGEIDSSFSEALMLSSPDKVYVKFKNPANAKVGDRYVIYRTVDEVQHPVTHNKVGFLTAYLGTLKVVSLSGKFVTAVIHETWDEITRGALVGPFGETVAERVAPKANTRSVKGYVVTALVPYLSLYAENLEVIIDRGSADGVEPGNVFTVVRQQDLGGNFTNPSKGQNKDLPVEEVATCLAVDVKEKTSNCLMTRSIREVVAGDRVEMRVGKSATTAQR